MLNQEGALFCFCFLFAYLVFFFLSALCTCLFASGYSCMLVTTFILTLSTFPPQVINMLKPKTRHKNSDKNFYTVRTDLSPNNLKLSLKLLLRLSLTSGWQGAGPYAWRVWDTCAVTLVPGRAFCTVSYFIELTIVCSVMPVLASAAGFHIKKCSPTWSWRRKLKTFRVFANHRNQMYKRKG